MDIDFNSHLWKLVKKVGKSEKFKMINLKDISWVAQAWESY